MTISITAFGIMALIKLTVCTMTIKIMTFNFLTIITISIKTLKPTTHSIKVNKWSTYLIVLLQEF
jgi:mRNA deadenylase 3'-5' endonuclease subunit Ccr4